MNQSVVLAKQALVVQKNRSEDEIWIENFLHNKITKQTVPAKKSDKGERRFDADSCG